jgi:two-component system nitrogen regulation response regulator GlnG
MGRQVAASRSGSEVAQAGVASDDLPTLVHSLFRWARSEPKRKLIPAVERELVVEALKETNGNQVQAARLLGITRATLRKRIEKFGIKQELDIH